MSETKVKYQGGSYLLSAQDPQAIFTPEDFTEDHKMIAKTTRDYAIGSIQPYQDEIEHQQFQHHRRIMKEMGELGLLGTDIPEMYGGLETDKVTSTLITENIVHGGSIALTHGAHTGIGTQPILFFGSPEQKAKYLPKLASGEWIAAYCLTEAGSGSDALGAKTTATLSPDGKYYILNGSKQWITNGGIADVFVVYAKVDGEKFSAFIVEKGFPGVSTGPEENKMGIKGSSTRTVILEDARVPVENLLGEIGKGHVIAFNILNLGRWKLAAGAVGTSKIALETAAKYANVRQQFGKPISSFSLIQQKLADMNTRIFVAESMVYRTCGYFDEALAGLDHSSPDAGQFSAKAISEYAIECSINKVFGSEVLDFVTDEAVQIHGGYGYMQEYLVERLYRDSRINRIFEGTNEINRLLIPGTLTRKAMKGELPFLQAIGKLQQELMAMSMPGDPPEGTLAQEQAMLENAKKIFLMVAGLGVQKYQMALEQEQEILAAVADIGIEIYAMESAILRALKTLSKHGADKAQNQLDMASLYTYQAMAKIEQWAKTALAAMEEGDTLRTQLSVLKRLLRYQPANTVKLQRAIAARVIAKETYVA
jgi:alkylation response protein AidB-like acyl-CoA dehydrogenase